jgi:predicted Zn-dependent protease
VGNAAWGSLCGTQPDNPVILEELPTILIAKGRKSEAIALARQLTKRFRNIRN